MVINYKVGLSRLYENDSLSNEEINSLDRLRINTLTDTESEERYSDLGEKAKNVLITYLHIEEKKFLERAKLQNPLVPTHDECRQAFIFWYLIQQLEHNKPKSLEESKREAVDIWKRSYVSTQKILKKFPFFPFM